VSTGSWTKLADIGMKSLESYGHKKARQDLAGHIKAGINGFLK
jgi:hypothetical protein